MHSFNYYFINVSSPWHGSGVEQTKTQYTKTLDFEEHIESIQGKCE